MECQGQYSARGKADFRLTINGARVDRAEEHGERADGTGCAGPDTAVESGELGPVSSED